MKNLLANPHLVFVVRMFIGLLFVVSSIEKIADPAAFTQSIANYSMLPSWAPPVIATVLPWLELLCGLSVLFGTLLHGSSLLLSCMLAAFTLAVIAALLRGLDISCGCFTQDPAAGKIGWLKVLQNSTLIVLTLFLYYSKSDWYSLPRYLQKSGTGIPGSR
ncbi:MAG TPA: MauE/DoxX family redox-associated membrane protein [Bacteroidota bacterium]|nr:MauE/DoxX family redox-associated membrane protein [Bacteroidota bacterium]